MNEKQKITIFNYAYNYLIGTLWWGREDFVTEHFKGWRKSDSVAHPLLSLKEETVTSIFEAIPMLVGTSGSNGELILRIGDGDKETIFSSMVASQCITANDFLFHEDGYDDDPETPISMRRRIWSNRKKDHLNDADLCTLKQFIAKRKKRAMKTQENNHE